MVRIGSDELGVVVESLGKSGDGSDGTSSWAPVKMSALRRFAKFGVDGIVPPRERSAVELADSSRLTSLIAQWPSAKKSESKTVK